MKKTIRTFGLFLFLLIIWEIAVLLFKIDTLFLPRPSAILKTLVIELFSWNYWQHILYTLCRTLGGFLISSFIGIILGILFGRFDSLYRLFEPLLDFLRSIPATALFPLFIFAVGVGDYSKILVVIYGCSLIVLINTVYGIKSINKSRIQSLKLYGFKQSQIVKLAIIPEALPSIYSGLKVALSLSLVLIIVTEMFIGTNKGLGFLIIQYQMVYKITEMYCAIITAGIFGLILNKIMIIIESKALHWTGN
jgi:ABC-type nitrate/sulfonate/bicarbonate transport system permease component